MQSKGASCKELTNKCNIHVTNYHCPFRQQGTTTTCTTAGYMNLAHRVYNTGFSEDFPSLYLTQLYQTAAT